ncbi:hypothetical protein IMG5_120030 [Ichthyophthirius multifiliis]|uniref:Cyclic nucleotide-binding domain-containing protein n=1 Tax=Ichthyophthirius multifiliis TaxID=5932 RepID=G0QUY2_ICHMU|nr:hypothetical protein IMG5_120030 [Ichthyophthirius multifiliis]EGR30987.1 hypothetical protein IMG5_120030 [Ichthyophthirius multifiliis]|eukprot:XP_004034473.1 hypothetical protein IMG5_120030 [Ichthyophthirius multifiliis]
MIFDYINRSSWIQIIVILLYKDILDLLTDYDEKYHLRERSNGIFDLIKLVCFILYMGHICGCFWNQIAMAERAAGYSDDQLWIQVFKPYWLDRYIDSMYWSVVTMCTLGYGDITPKTRFEKMYVMAVVLVSTFVFAFSMNLIGDTIKEFYRKQKDFEDYIQKINIYMKKRKINEDTQIRIRKYLKHLNQRNENMNSKVLLDQLEDDLREKVQYDIFGTLLNKQSLLKYQFDVFKLAQKMEEKVLSFNQFIYQENDQSEYLYFLLKGSISFYTQKNQLLLSTSSQKGKMFGELEFFSGLQYRHSAKTNSMVILAQISKQNFLQIVKEDNKYLEKFMQLKDQYNIYKNYYGHQCGTCQKYGHDMLDCPMINFLAKKYQLTIEQDNNRQSCIRRKTNKFNTLKEAKITLQKYKYRQELVKYGNKYFNKQNLQSFDSVYFSNSDQINSSVQEKKNKYQKKLKNSLSLNYFQEILNKKIKIKTDQRNYKKWLKSKNHIL